MELIWAPSFLSNRNSVPYILKLSSFSNVTDSRLGTEKAVEDPVLEEFTV